MTASASVAAQMAWRKGLTQGAADMAITLKRLSKLWPDPSAIGTGLWSGSGRFYGAISEQGFIQQPDHPDNNGDIGEVKNIPAEVPGRGGDMEMGEVENRPISQAVDGVANCPANDQAQRHRRPAGRHPRHPHPEQDHGDGLETEQGPLAELAFLLKQAVADALVPEHVDIEERRECKGTLRADVVDLEQPQLDGLVEQ